MGLVMVINSGSNKNKWKSSGVGETTTKDGPGHAAGFYDLPWHRQINARTYRLPRIAQRNERQHMCI